MTLLPDVTMFSVQAAFVCETKIACHALFSSFYHFFSDCICVHGIFNLKQGDLVAVPHDADGRPVRSRPRGGTGVPTYRRCTGQRRTGGVAGTVLYGGVRTKSGNGDARVWSVVVSTWFSTYSRIARANPHSTITDSHSTHTGTPPTYALGGHLAVARFNWTPPSADRERSGDRHLGKTNMRAEVGREVDDIDHDVRSHARRCPAYYVLTERVGDRFATLVTSFRLSPHIGQVVTF